MAIGSNTGKAMARKGIGPSLREIAAVEREQPLPVPLGGVAVVDRALGEGKAVMRAGIDLDLGIGAVGLRLLFYFLDDLHRRVDVGLGATEIEFGLGLLSGKVRTVGPVGGQLYAVDRSGGLDAAREMRRRVDGVLSAHAITDRADDVRARGGLRVGVGKQRLGIFHDQRNVELVD